MPDGQTTSPAPAAGPRRARRFGLLARFLLILTPVFLLLAVPGIGFLVQYELRADREVLAARIGNQAARVAAALSRHLDRRDPGLNQDLLAPLAADRAFLCASFTGPDGAVKAQWPPGSGCVGVAEGAELNFPVGVDDECTLTVRFSDAEMRAAERLALTIALSVIGIAFLFALLASAIGFRFIVGKPLGLLLGAIRRAAKTGERAPVAWRSRDELGEVIAAFDEMLQRETAREDALQSLNAELEKRVKARTAALEKTMHRAQQANESKTRFLWAMSHELRTPLNAIIGFSEMIRDTQLGAIGDERYAEYAGDIAVNGHQLLTVINNVLELAQLDAGKDKLADDAVDLHKLMKGCAAATAEDCAARGIALTVTPPGGPARITADADRLRRALSNLLSNAIKYTPNGGTVTVTAICDAADGIAITVTDTGCGIAAENIPTALAAFGRLDESLTRHSGGTGLGLPVARLIAEAHGGSLTLDSTPGTGTSVTLRLPADRISAPETVLA